MANRRLIFLSFQLPLIVGFAALFLVAHCGDEGRMHTPVLESIAGSFTDLKFHVRGKRPLDHKIVIVEIDEEALDQVGRWPWHRDAMAVLIQSAFDAGARVVGLDIVFAEPDVRVPEALADLLRENHLDDRIATFETDLTLQRIIAVNRDHLVLGWQSDDHCFAALDGCGEPADLPRAFEKFAIGKVTGPADRAADRLSVVPTIIGNIDGYDEAAAHSGYFLGWPDSDDVVRKAFVAATVHGRVFPSLALEMARVGLGDDLAIDLADDGSVNRLGFDRTGTELPVSPQGGLAIDFLGPAYHEGPFTWVPAVALIGEDARIPVRSNGVGTLVPRADVFKDAYVFIGLSAVGVNDLRNFPFSRTKPGVEGHATVLENILSRRFMRTGAGWCDWRLVLALVTLGALAFGLALQRLEAVPAVLLLAGVAVAVAVLDVELLFAHRDINLDTVLLYLEIVALFVVTLAVKYVLEERSKKFIRGTFSKYLAPAVVDEMLKDPAKLHLAGENQRLTIMMSDLRGFTAMAERLKPEQVLGVLNHYLSTMTDIIVEYQGTIDEFIGDAILVIFGAPIQRPDDARRAVACAIAMQRAMTGINAHNAKLGLPPIEMGIALNTGEVIVGNIGSQKHIKYGVVGSHVNLTARIESNTVGGQLLISASTLKLAGDDLKIGEHQMIVAKGFPEPIAAYDILGIGGEYNLFLDEIELGLALVAAPIDVRFRVMLSKNEEGEERAGALRAVSGMGAVLEHTGELEEFKNLKIRFVQPTGELVDGDLYAKVIDAGPPCKLRFTGVPPHVARFISTRIRTVRIELP